MSLENKLDTALTIGISSSSTRDHNKSDLVKLMKSYGIIEKAKDALLAQEITFDEYLQLCEIHSFNVDSYLETVEYNLKALQLI